MAQALKMQDVTGWDLELKGTELKGTELKRG